MRYEVIYRELPRKYPEKSRVSSKKGHKNIQQFLEKLWRKFGLVDELIWKIVEGLFSLSWGNL